MPQAPLAGNNPNEIGKPSNKATLLTVWSLYWCPPCPPRSFRLLLSFPWPRPWL